MDVVYLDHNATTPPSDAVTAAMVEALTELWANPSSVHRFGQRVRQRLELARQAVAKLLNASPNELIFTSGGTESDTLALQGSLHAPGSVLLTTKVEHAAVREPAEAFAQQGGEVRWLPTDSDGVVHVAGLESELEQLVRQRVAHPRDDGRPGLTLISIQWANNETGVIQPVAELAGAVEAARQLQRDAGQRPTLRLHLDATQAVGKLPVDVKAAGCDLLTFTAHKFHGPKGVGGLWVRRGTPLRPVVRGGPQERDRRGGTENVPGVLALGVAAAEAVAFLAEPSRAQAQEKLRDEMEASVRAVHPDVVVNGGGAPRLWNTSNLGFPGLEAEAILLGLSELGVCASAGAACSSGSLDPSPVLRAMGVPEAVAHGSIRLSLSKHTTAGEVEQAVTALGRVVERLRQVMPMG